jgi:hypothetical protein
VRSLSLSTFLPVRLRHGAWCEARYPFSRFSRRSHRPFLNFSSLFLAKADRSAPSSYAVHGGGFPLRVKGVETLIAVIVVCTLPFFLSSFRLQSCPALRRFLHLLTLLTQLVHCRPAAGLKQEDDHQVIVDSVEEYIMQQSQ